MIKNSLLLFLLFSGWNAKAQQDPMFTKYIFNNSIFVNPASAGRQPYWNTDLMYRHQWVRFDGAPQTAAFSIDGPISDGRMGLGLSVFHDKIGVDRNTGVFGNYAYRFPVGKHAVLSMGLRGGVNILSNDFSSIITPDAVIDPVYAAGNILVVPKFGTGIFLNTDRAYVGLSVPTLAAFVPGGSFQVADDGAFLAKHYYLSGGYVFDLDHGDIQLKPFVFIKFQKAAPVEVDANVQVWFRNIFSCGLSYRTGDAIAAMVEIPVYKGLHLGYAYDYTISKIRPYSNGVHEVMVSYRFGEKVKNPRSIHKHPEIKRF